jgi:PPOX class probable F420-dependent enzyme
MALSDEKYLSFTTFKKDGTPKPTPIWIADLGDGTMGFTTNEDAWKIKRLKTNPNVMVQPCDMKGEITDGTTAIEGTATYVTGGPDFEKVRGLIDKKYGFAVRVIKIINGVRNLLGKGGQSDTAVIITFK